MGILKYFLRTNSFSTKKEDYVAHTIDVETYFKEDIVNRMALKGSIPKETILAVLLLEEETIGELVAEGKAINTPLYTVNYSITGKFSTFAQGFDRLLHKIVANLNPGVIIIKALERLSSMKVEAKDNLPNIVEVIDSVTGSVNNIITAKGTLKIFGNHFKIFGDSPLNGIYFVAADGTKHKVVTITDNMPKTLIITIPDLPPGKYTLMITTQYSSGKGIKEPRTGIFSISLTVV